MSEGGELSAMATILRSVWFRMLWRTAVIVGGFILTGIGGFIYASTTQVQKDVLALQQEVQAIKVMAADFTALRAQVHELGIDLSAVRLDTATIKGVLQEMRRGGLAADVKALIDGGPQ